MNQFDSVVAQTTQVPVEGGGGSEETQWTPLGGLCLLAFIAFMICGIWGHVSKKKRYGFGGAIWEE